MSTAVTKARVTGAMFLLTVVAGIVAQGLISGRLVAPADAGATAANIAAHRSLYQLGFTLYLIEMAAQVVMTTLFYDLLRPVSKSVALLSTIFGLVGCTIKAMSRLFYLAPLLVVGGAAYLTGFSADQRNALSLFLVEVNDSGAAIALVFFGFGTLLQGYLILRSTFLPRALGILGVLGGVGWLTFLSPPVGARLFPYVAGVGLLGSLAMIVWLLVFGVNEQRWKEQAS